MICICAYTAGPLTTMSERVNAKNGIERTANTFRADVGFVELGVSF